jgi:serine/threonine protein kinase
MIGNVVGNYKIVEKIGEGGMGAVYKGIDLMLEREVAIKVLKPELGSQPQVVERFRAEAVTLAKLSHPNIATLFSFFRQGDYLFMVLEYVKGTTLDKIIETRGVMTCEQAIPLFCQMLEGIDHAHSFGIVHRDIKPGNMMLTENGLLKVLDFGIARALGSARMTRAGNLIGTIEYMSPEQVRGMETDARSDIYSLGMVLYELLTGRVPFASDSEYELMKAQVEQLPTPPREFAPNIPEQVEWAILCATEKDPTNRFQTAGVFSSAIVDCVKTAIATGQLSQIDMQRVTGRLSASSAVTDLLSSPSSTESPLRISHPDPLVSVETTHSSLETQRLPPATRLASNSEHAMASASSPAIKMTRLGDATDFNNAGMVNTTGMRQQVSVPLSQRLTRKHYIAGGILAGLFVGIIILGISVMLLRASRANGEKVDSPPSFATSQPTNTKPAQDTNQGEGTTDVRKDSEVLGDSERPAATNRRESLQEADSSVPATPVRQTSKAVRNDSAARERARRAREALDNK